VIETRPRRSVRIVHMIAELVEPVGKIGKGLMEKFAPVKNVTPRLQSDRICR